MLKIANNGYKLGVDSKGVLSLIACFNDTERKLLKSYPEFDSSYDSFERVVERLADGFKTTVKTSQFDGESIVRIVGDVVERRQRFIVKKKFKGFFRIGFDLVDDEALYTYPLRCYDKPIKQVGNIRNDYLWAVPLPAHIWRTEEYVCAYFIDRSQGVGTCDISQNEKGVSLGFYYPDSTQHEEIIMPFTASSIPTEKVFEAGEEVCFVEYFWCGEADKEENPLIQAEKAISKTLLFDKPIPTPDLKDVAEGIAYYYANNDLWEKDAFGENKGWFRNMWKRTYGGIPEKDFYFDLGWGEGYGAITISALVRYSMRTGNKIFADRIYDMVENIDMFLRNPDEKGMYYDRIIPLGKPTLLGRYLNHTNCDFLGIDRIWTHSLAMVGYQFANLYEECRAYDEILSRKWLSVAEDIAKLLMQKQNDQGDIQDGFDANDKEANKKKHRIPARAIACGLFATLFRITGEREYLVAGEKLAKAVAPEINNYDFYNQMLDAHVDVINGQIVESGKDDRSEVYDGENACYAFSGLVELYEITKEETILKLCKNCAAYFTSWMYYYDVPTGANGYSRGATVCRMPDFPLCYIGAGNFAIPALVKFSKITGDDFYKKIAQEMMNCACRYQWKDEKVKWYGAVVHAVYQVNGKHWGPDIQGQMDTGMTSGTTLMNIEKWFKGNC